jgi:hypothetical protein
LSIKAKKNFFSVEKLIHRLFGINAINHFNIYIKYRTVIGLDFQKYKSYGSDDFVMDEHFTRWVHKPNDSILSNFWESLIRVYPEKMEEIIQARNKILQPSQKFQSLSPCEIDELWKQINITITTI